MKKILLTAIILCLTFLHVQAQASNSKSTISAKKNTTKTAAPIITHNVDLTNEEITAGLKEALKLSADSASIILSTEDGFFADSTVKILMPEQAQAVEMTLRKSGLSFLVDNAILSMNRAAEDASTNLDTMFYRAIERLLITDPLQVLKSKNPAAATAALKEASFADLKIRFKSKVVAALTKANANKYWKDVFATYNHNSLTPINVNLADYVTDKALTGLFIKIAVQEQKIRLHLTHTTGTIQYVFGCKQLG